MTFRAVKILTIWCTAVVWLIASAVLAAAEKRVALVIGNSAYQHTTSLLNPSNDAEDITAKLRRLNFDVVTGNDLTGDEFSQLVIA